MPLPKFYKVCQDQQGNIVPQVLGSVFNHGTAVLASLYNDDAGTVPLSNPMTSDAQYGSFKFYVNPGHYDLTFTKPGYTFEPINDMQVPQDVLTLGTMATQNANAVAITGGDVVGLTTLSAGTSVAPGYALAASNAHIVTGLVNDGLTGLGMGVHTSYRLVLAPVGVNAINTTGNLALNIDPPAFMLHCNGAAGTPGGAWVNSTSRAALKTAIRPLQDALTTLARLQPRQWEWRDAYPELEALMPGTQIGFVTEEIAEALPHTAHRDQQGELAHSERGLVALLVGAVQALVQRVEEVEARLA